MQLKTQRWILASHMVLPVQYNGPRVLVAISDV